MAFLSRSHRAQAVSSTGCVGPLKYTQPQGTGTREGPGRSFAVTHWNRWRVVPPPQGTRSTAPQWPGRPGWSLSAQIAGIPVRSTPTYPRTTTPDAMALLNAMVSGLEVT